MKKNKTIKAAALLLALVLLTSGFTGGMLAKYVTRREGGGSARTAQWGIQIEAGAGGFASEYTAPGSDTVTVRADGPVVAPGTSGNLKSVTITGTPEVAGTLTFSADVNLEGWAISSTRMVPKLPNPSNFNGDFFYEGYNIYLGSKNATNKHKYGINIDKYPDWMDRLEEAEIWTSCTDDRANVKKWAREEGNNLEERLFEYKGEWYFSIPYISYTHNHVGIFKLLDKTLINETPLVWDEFVEVSAEEVYIPLVVTVGDTVINGLNYVSAASFEKAVEDAVAGYTVEFAPGDDLSAAAPAITWEWPFSTSEENDAKDVALCSLAALPTIEVAVTAVAAQID